MIKKSEERAILSSVIRPNLKKSSFIIVQRLNNSSYEPKYTGGSMMMLSYKEVSKIFRQKVIYEYWEMHK